jgi:sugar/nucleoside kinase (ribokinase family)
MIRYVAFGVMLDDIVTWRGSTHMGILGGGGVQTAWGMAVAVGNGREVGLVGDIGQDLPNDIFAPLKHAEIDLQGIQTRYVQTNRAWQLIEADGKRTQVWRTRNAPLGWHSDDLWLSLPKAYQEAQAFHWGIHPDNTPLDFAQELRQKGRLVSLEAFCGVEKPLAPSRLRDMLQACDVFSCTQDELFSLTGGHELATATQILMDNGCRCMTIRRGAKGCWVWHPLQGQAHISALDVRALDVIGAGNAFCGAFVAQLEVGVVQAACHATVVASFMVEQVGLPLRLPSASVYTKRLKSVQQSVREKLL